jgi:hypothetical protein
MRHYALDQWVDFTRGVAALDERARMAEHLGAGCNRCQREADFCAQVNYVCERLDTQQVPESVTRMARAIFPFRGPQRPTRGTRLPIELIFDSFLAPAPAGFRATWQVGWQGLYRAGDCSIDLRIEPELKSTRAAVIGQISNHVLPKVEMSNIPVSLRSGKQVVAETLSNRFGEFQMEYEQQARLKLCICLKDGSSVKDGSRNIQVPLKRFTSEKPAATHRAPRRKRTATEPQ